MRPVTRFPILNIWVDDVDMERALEQAALFVEQGERLHTVFAANPEKNYSVPRDPVLYEAFRDADLLLPDGIGVVMAARLLHRVRLQRVPGCEFMEKLCAWAARSGEGVYMYGAREEVNRRAAEVLERKYPGLSIRGRCHGYVDDEDMDALVEDIKGSGASILFLALGSPRQENWVDRHGARLGNIRVCQGIGGTLDVIAGYAERAPELFARTGFEWLYRLLKEPKRIKRQLALPKFLLDMLRTRARGQGFCTRNT